MPKTSGSELARLRFLHFQHGKPVLFWNVGAVAPNHQPELMLTLAFEFSILGERVS